MEMVLLAGVGLILLGLMLIFIEAFVPSGGVIGIAAALCAIAGVVVLFRYDTLWGMIGSLTVLVLGPIAFISAINLLPNTKMGRRMMGPGAEEIARERAEFERPHAEQRRALLDCEGIAKTALHPVGIVEIEGTRHDAIAHGGIIDQGTAIRVTSVDGLQITVRAVDSGA